MKVIFQLNHWYNMLLLKRLNINKQFILLELNNNFKYEINDIVRTKLIIHF